MDKSGDKPARKVLGRGLSALLPPRPQGVGNGTAAQAAPAHAVALPIAEIDPNPLQPRSVFDAARLQELAASIEANGIIQPLIVRRKGVRCELIAGERRLRAAQLAGLTEVPVVIQDYADDRVLEVARRWSRVGSNSPSWMSSSSVVMPRARAACSTSALRRRASGPPASRQ